MNQQVEISKILMKWSLENEEWYITLLLYKKLNIGIPNKFLYNMPQKNTFNSVNDILSTKDNNILYHNNSKFLNALLLSFKHSKWCILEEWGDFYGYKYYL